MYLDENYKYAFIDESGNFGYDLDNEDISNYFIITAIIINPNKMAEMKEKLNKIKKDYFSNSEIKSSVIGNDYVKRINILKEITNLDFDILSYVVDKKSIDKNRALGMTFKTSFLKCIHRHLHEELISHYESLKVVSDEYGTKEFMDSFKDYFQENEMYLCSKYVFEYGNSKDNIFIQLADLICGTIAYKYEARKHKDKYKVFLNIIKNKTIRIEEWPIEYKNYLMDLDFLKSGEYDKEIAKHCLNLSLKYIERENFGESHEETDRKNIVKFLLYKLRYEDQNSYFTSKIINAHIYRLTNRYYSNHQFKTSLIAKLRDEGVILSSSNKGYKIPVSENELYSYTNHTIQVVYPMLERLNKCRKNIPALTSNELDILNREEYKEIKDYFDYIKAGKF